MVNNRIKRQLWDYSVIWVAEVMSMTYSSGNSSNEGIPLTNVTGETFDISEYLDFVSMTKFVSRIMLDYLLMNLGGG